MLRRARGWAAGPVIIVLCQRLDVIKFALLLTSHRSLKISGQWWCTVRAQDNGHWQTRSLEVTGDRDGRCFKLWRYQMAVTATCTWSWLCFKLGLGWVYMRLCDNHWPHTLEAERTPRSNIASPNFSNVSIREIRSATWSSARSEGYPFSQLSYILEFLQNVLDRFHSPEKNWFP